MEENKVSGEVIESVEQTKETASTEIAEIGTSDLGINPFGNTETFNDYWKMAKLLCQSEMIPSAYQNKPMNVMIAIEQANRMHCSPLMVMQNLNVIKGKPSWSGSACSMIVNGCGLFENVTLTYVGTKGSLDWGAYVKATRKSDGAEIVGSTITMQMAKDEGWLNNPKWKSMPEQMLGYRAYAFFARLHCPNALSGFSIEGEIEDSMTRAPHKASVDFS